MKNPTYNQAETLAEPYFYPSTKADSQTKNLKGHIMKKIYAITVMAFSLFCFTSFAVKADDGLANTLIKCDSAHAADIKSAVERNLGHVSVILHENENTYLYCKLNQDRYERIALLECDYITEILQFSDVERASDMAQAQLYVDESINYGSFEEMTDLIGHPDDNDMSSPISLLEPDSLPLEWICLDDSSGLPPDKGNSDDEFMSTQSWSDFLGKRQIEDVLHGLIALIIFFPEGDEPHFQHTKSSIDSMKVHILAELDWMVYQASMNDIPLTFDVIFPSNQPTGAFRIGLTPAWGALGKACDEPEEEGCVTNWIGELINIYGGYIQNYNGMIDLLNDRIQETGAGYSGVVFIPEMAGNHCFRYDKLPVGGWSARWIHPCWDEDNFDVPWHGDCESDYNRYYGASYAVVLKGYYPIPKTAMIALHEILHWFGPTDLGNCDYWPYPGGQGFGYWQVKHGCTNWPDIMNADSFQHTLTWMTKDDLGWIRDGDDGPLKHLDCGFPGYYCFTTTGHDLELGDIIRLGIIQGGDHLVFVKRLVVNPYNSYISPYNGKRHVYFNGTNYAGYEIAIGNLLWADINFSGDWFLIGGLVGEGQGTGFTDASIVGDTLYLTVKGIQAWCKVLLKQGSAIRQMPLHYKMLFGIESDPATWALPIDIPADGDYTIEAYSYASNGQDRADTFYVSVQNGPPNAPLLESVDLDNASGKVNLLWQDGGNYTQTFQVVQNSNTIAELPDTITEYSHDYLWGSRTFAYTVAAENSNGVAPAVDTVYVTSLPNRPCNLRGYVHRVDSLIGSYGKIKPENPPGPYINKITFEWDKPQRNLYEIVGYRLHVGHYHTGSEYISEYYWLDSTSITLSELEPYRQYNFRLRAFDENGDSSLFTGLFSLTTGQWDPYNQLALVQKDNANKPSFRLSQNYLNPFNTNTSITVEIESGNHVSLDVFNILGQNIRTLYDDFMDMGVHTVCWGGLDDQGLSAASGIYFIRIKVGNKIESRKMLLLK